MRVNCRHGHFAFYPRDQKEVLRFKKLFGLPLVQEDDYFTLEGLAELPRWSQIGKPIAFGQIPAIVTYEGRGPWDVMRANGFVYSLATELLVPFTTIAEVVKLPQTQDCCIAPKPLIQAGALLQGGLVPGNVLLGYQGEIDLDFQRLYIYAQETLL